MNDIHFSLKQLRGCIGIHVLFDGESCQVIEVLEEFPSVVLQHTDDKQIQHNQHGDPHRKVPQTYTVPILTDDRQQFHPLFLALDLL